MSPHRILVVDDDLDVRNLMLLVLAGEGYEVEGVAGGPEALQRLAQDPYDLIICDLDMPAVDGAAVYRVSRAMLTPRPPVLFISGFHDAAQYSAFLRDTAAPVLAKPFDIDTLCKAVADLLGDA